MFVHRKRKGVPRVFGDFWMWKDLDAVWNLSKSLWGISVKQPLLSTVWLTEGGKRWKKWRNYGQKLSSKNLDFSSMSSFQIVFSRGISIVICNSKAKKTDLQGKSAAELGIIQRSVLSNVLSISYHCEHNISPPHAIKCEKKRCLKESH